jgi:hypothetical protein
LEFHTSLVGGHSIFLKTYHRVKKEYFWEGLKTDVQRFVEEFLVFQQNKVEIIKTLVFYNHYPSQVSVGSIFPWISSQGYQNMKERVSAW